MDEGDECDSSVFRATHDLPQNTTELCAFLKRFPKGSLTENWIHLAQSTRGPWAVCCNTYLAHMIKREGGCIQTSPKNIYNNLFRCSSMSLYFRTDLLCYPKSTHPSNILPTSQNRYFVGSGAPAACGGHHS